MGKTPAAKKTQASRKSTRPVKLTERALRGIAQLRPASRSMSASLSVPGFEKMVKRSRVGLPVWSNALHVSTAALEQRMEQNSAFDALEADRLHTVEQVLKRGMDVFEDTDDLTAWLERKHRLLANQRPMDLLGSTAGIGLVMMELGRIEHGVF